MNRIHQHHGYTLVELITVIVLLGIIGSFTFSYITFGARIYTDAVGRDQVVSQSRFALNRLIDELALAVPRSVLAPNNGQCLEFVPMLASGQYLNLPLPGIPNEDLVVVAPDAPASSLVGAYVFIFANEPDFIYDNVSNSRRKQITSVDLNQPANGLMTLSYTDTPLYFATQSPGRRYYIGSAPVRWCVDSNNGTLTRISGYSIALGGVNNVVGPSQEVMAVGLVNTGSQVPFRVIDPTLERNSLVQIDFRFERGATGEPLQFAHEVFLPNVP